MRPTHGRRAADDQADYESTLRIKYGIMRLSRLHHIRRDGATSSFLATMLANSGLVPKMQWSQLNAHSQLFCCQCGKEANEISLIWNLTNIFKISIYLTDLHSAICVFCSARALEPNIPTMQGLYIRHLFYRMF